MAADRGAGRRFLKRDGAKEEEEEEEAGPDHPVHFKGKRSQQESGAPRTGCGAGKKERAARTLAHPRGFGAPVRTGYMGDTPDRQHG